MSRADVVKRYGPTLREVRDGCVFRIREYQEGEPLWELWRLGLVIVRTRQCSREMSIALGRKAEDTVLAKLTAEGRRAAECL